MLRCVSNRVHTGRIGALANAKSYGKTRRYATHSKQPEKLKVFFMGRDEFSCLVLEELHKARDVWDELVIATNPDQRVGRRGCQLSVSPLKLKVQSLNDAHLHFIPPTKAEFRKWKLPAPFQGYNFESDTSSPANPPPLSHVLVTASFGRILTKKHLAHFQPARRLNVHPSLLPQYRGPAPIQHALLNGESETGVCIIEMLPATKKTSGESPPKSGIDAGDVWASKTMPQPGDATFNQMRDALGREGGKLLVQVLRQMVNRSEALPVPQRLDENRDIRPAPMIELQDAHFDPQQLTAEEVSRRWRAIGHQRPITTFVEITSESSGSVTKRAVQLHDLQVRPDIAGDAALRALPLSPGAVICARPNSEPTKSLFVRCEDGGVISVRDVKPEGKPLLDAQSFWNGVHSKNHKVRFVGA